MPLKLLQKIVVKLLQKVSKPQICRGSSLSLLNLDAGELVGHGESELLAALDDLLALALGDVGGDLDSVLGVVHDEHVQVLGVGNLGNYWVVIDSVC